MPRSAKAFLWDIEDAVLSVESFVKDLGFDDYRVSGLVQAAVERKFSIIGEALSQLGKLAPEMLDHIPEAPRIIAFRNILVHGYAAIDQVRVWEIIQTYLPHLKSAVSRLLKTA